jgi:hypothetical protein
LVQSLVGDTHAPKKFVNIGDLLLMGFGSENDGGAPSALAQSNPTIVKENLNLGHNDLAFMRPITRLSAADWWRPASINSEFEMKDGFHDASRVNKSQDDSMMEVMRAWPDSRFGIRTDNEILVEFRKVTPAIPEMDVRASVGEGNRCPEARRCRFQPPPIPTPTSFAAHLLL